MFKACQRHDFIETPASPVALIRGFRCLHLGLVAGGFDDIPDKEAIVRKGN